MGLVKLFESRGVKIDPKGKSGQAALGGAITSQNPELLDYFIAQGVDVNGYGISQKPNSEFLVLYAVKQAEDGKIASLKRLLDAGANPNDQSGNSPALFEAIQNGKERPEIAILLLDHGANPNTFDDRERVHAIWAAVLWDRIEVAQALLKKGASPNVKDKGKTPLDLAIDWEPHRLGFTKLLKQYGAKTRQEL